MSPPGANVRSMAPTDEALLERLAAAGWAEGDAPHEYNLRWTVLAIRNRDVGWDQIGARLGVTGDQAADRWAEAVEALAAENREVQELLQSICSQIYGLTDEQWEKFSRENPILPGVLATD